MKRILTVCLLAFAAIPTGAQGYYSGGPCAHYHGPTNYPTAHGGGPHVHSSCHYGSVENGRTCTFDSTTDSTREAGWQTGVIGAGPFLAGEDGTMVCKISANNDTHSSTNIRAVASFSSIAGVVVGAEQLNYQATAADDISLCTSWHGASGTLYWTGGNTATGEVGHWSTDPGSSCGVALSIEPNDPECSIWKAIDRRLGTNIAEIWQDCEPYEELPLPI